MSDYVLGLDLNRYRADVPLKTAKGQGVRFLLCKCSEGTSYTDHTYGPYQVEAKARYLPFGGYLYWRFQFDAVKQAEYYVDHLGEVQFPPIVDVERIYNVKPGTKLPIVSIQANRNHLAIVLDVIEDKTGLVPMIYTNFATWRALFGDWDIFDKHELWVANWRLGHSPYLPVPAVDWTVHQFTSVYKVEGYYRGLDANWFNGNEEVFEQQLAEWHKLWHPSAPTPPPTLETFVTLDITKNGNTEIILLKPGDYFKLSVEELHNE